MFACFAGAKGTQEYRSLEEQLTQLMLRTDAILAGEKASRAVVAQVRAARKALVLDIQAQLESLERSAAAPTAERSLVAYTDDGDADADPPFEDAASTTRD